jgi:hypothetical protein
MAQSEFTVGGKGMSFEEAISNHKIEQVTVRKLTLLERIR